MKLTAPDAACMERFRQRLIQDPDSVLSLTKRLEQEEGIVFSGTEYKRKKPGETPETAPLFQRKNLFAVKTMPVGDTLFSPALPDAVIPTFRALLPLMELFGKQEQAKVQEGDAAYPSAVIEEKYGGFMW